MWNVNGRQMNSSTKEINDLILEDKIKLKIEQPRKNLMKCYKDTQNNHRSFTMVMIKIASLKKINSKFIS